MSNTRRLNGWEYPNSGEISHPFVLNEGDDILAYDAEVVAWVLVRVKENTGYMILLRGLEGSLGALNWWESYENLQDDRLYRNPGRYDI